jgi:hypothetical protein
MLHECVRGLALGAAWIFGGNPISEVVKLLILQGIQGQGKRRDLNSGKVRG